MKRHESLAGLSRDHQHALAVSLRLRRASTETAAEAVAAFLEFWQTEGKRHFREEEEVLLPAYAAHGSLEAPVLARVLLDHVRIRQLADATAASAPAPELADLHTLGERLADHVRREERELFPMIEAALPEAELKRLRSLLG